MWWVICTRCFFDKHLSGDGPYVSRIQENCDMCGRSDYKRWFKVPSVGLQRSSV